MNISNQSKQILHQEKDRLEYLKSQVQKQIDDLDVQRAKLVSRKNDYVTAINNLKLDIDNG